MVLFLQLSCKDPKQNICHLLWPIVSSSIAISEVENTLSKLKDEVSNVYETEERYPNDVPPVGGYYSTEYNLSVLAKYLMMYAKKSRPTVTKWCESITAKSFLLVSR